MWLRSPQRAVTSKATPSPLAISTLSLSGVPIHHDVFIASSILRLWCFWQGAWNARNKGLGICSLGRWPLASGWRSIGGIGRLLCQWTRFGSAVGGLLVIWVSPRHASIGTPRGRVLSRDASQSLFCLTQLCLQFLQLLLARCDSLFPAASQQRCSTTASGYAHFSSTVLDRLSTPGGAFKPNIESRSAAKFCAIVLRGCQPLQDMCSVD